MPAEVSSALAVLNSTPRRAPRPVPTMTAVGVARPSASGQVMTTTVIANSIASLAGRPSAIHARNVASAADEGDEDEPERRPVGQPLPGRLAVLRLLDQRHDLRQRGVLADLRGAHPQRAGGVHRRPDHRRAGLLAHRQALAGDHGLVDLGHAVLDDAVHRHLRAGPDQQQVADRDVGGVDLDPVAVALHQRLGGRELEQGADRVVGAAAGPHLEPVAEQHERGQHRGGLVEDLAAAGERDHEAVQPAGADRDGDEHHHVQRPVPQRPDGAVEEDPARPEDDRAGSAAGRTRRRAARTGAGTVEPEHVAADRRPQQDRHRQHRRDDEPAAHVRDHVGHRHARVPAVTHRLVRAHVAPAWPA